MPLRQWLTIHLKKIFMGKEKKKIINVLIVLSISHKGGVKTFLKWIVNHYLYHCAIIWTTHICVLCYFKKLCEYLV